MFTLLQTLRQRVLDALARNAAASARLLDTPPAVRASSANGRLHATHWRVDERR